ncbi:hypothetical protein [Streptosporangium roseum]|uniref:hypothetical protein n=1 Tax=Streptosporangium roseum TaxID=2001 RepID=UPI00341B1325
MRGVLRAATWANARRIRSAPTSHNRSFLRIAHRRHRHTELLCPRWRRPEWGPLKPADWLSGARAVLADDADRITAAVDDLLQIVDGGGPGSGWQLRAVALAEAVAARAAVAEAGPLTYGPAAR